MVDTYETANKKYNAIHLHMEVAALGILPFISGTKAVCDLCSGDRRAEKYMIAMQKRNMNLNERERVDVLKHGNL